MLCVTSQVILATGTHDLPLTLDIVNHSIQLIPIQVIIYACHSIILKLRPQLHIVLWARLLVGSVELALGFHQNAVVNCDESASTDREFYGAQSLPPYHMQMIPKLSSYVFDALRNMQWMFKRNVFIIALTQFCSQAGMMLPSMLTANVGDEKSYYFRRQDSC